MKHSVVSRQLQHVSTGSIVQIEPCSVVFTWRVTVPLFKLTVALLKLDKDYSIFLLSSAPPSFLSAFLLSDHHWMTSHRNLGV